MVSGIIIMWHGSIASIPTGFVLCDGNNGTPDLRNRFVVGAGDTYDPGDQGGSNTHTHTFTGSGHNHTIPGGAAIDAGIGKGSVVSTESAAGTTDAGESRPLYYSLAFIMKT